VPPPLQLTVTLTYKNPAYERAWLFGHPGTLTPASVVTTLLGLTTTAWAYVPSFLTVELASAMERPADFRKSLCLSAALILALFVGLGVASVVAWGWNIPDPVFLIQAWPAHLASSRFMQFLILLANIVCYALDSVPLVRYCQTVWVPTFADDWSPRSILVYLGISLPTFLFGVVAAIVVGNLFTMLAFVTAVTVPWVTQIIPATFYYFHRTRSVQGGSVQGSGKVPLTHRERLLIAGVLLVGILNFFICLVSQGWYRNSPGCSVWN
jgi:hypothetical protein